MGCGQTGAATGVRNLQISVGGQARTYVLSVPTAYNPATAYPLVLAWHGLGGTGMLARQYFRVEQAAAGQAIFVYPDGLPLTNQGNEPGWDLTAAGRDVQLFDALVAEVSRTYCIASHRIFSTGHSFGGFFSNRLGCYRGSVLRAIAPVAGAPPSGACTGEVAAWIAHGTNDPTVPYTQGEGTRTFWTGRNGCSTTTAATTPSPCVAYQGCGADLPVHWCSHTGMHEWPSFAAAGIWGFFSNLR
jgi:poly(3-hydroxybutyrate) depolymerase